MCCVTCVWIVYGTEVYKNGHLFLFLCVCVCVCIFVLWIRTFWGVFFILIWEELSVMFCHFQLFFYCCALLCFLVYLSFDLGYATIVLASCRFWFFYCFNVQRLHSFFASVWLVIKVLNLYGHTNSRWASALPQSTLMSSFLGFRFCATVLWLPGGWPGVEFPGHNLTNSPAAFCQQTRVLCFPECQPL